MAGRGPAPKPPERRAGHSTPNAQGLRVITASPMSQPDLPEDVPIYVKVERDGTVEMDTHSWPDQTRQWWKMWANSPLSADFTATDWSELMDAALLHAAYWRGDLKLAGELRLRVAKFGATPEDRARLRITFAQADDAEDKRPPAPSSRSRRPILKALPEAK